MYGAGHYAPRARAPALPPHTRRRIDADAAADAVVAGATPPSPSTRAPAADLPLRSPRATRAPAHSVPRPLCLARVRAPALPPHTCRRIDADVAADAVVAGATPPSPSTRA